MELNFSNKELERAKRSLEKMKEIYSKKGLDFLIEFESNWIDFLNNLEKIWKKSELECKGFEKFQPWQGKYKRERRKDPLLKYLKNARDSDQHSLQVIIKGEGYKAEITSPKQGFTYNMGETITITASLTEPFIEVVSFKNHKVLYEVPTEHLGKIIENFKHPITLAELGIQYYEEYLEKIRAKFLT